MTPQNSDNSVLDCLELIQKKLLARGYKYHDVEPDVWPECDVLMCLDEVALLICRLPEVVSDEYIKHLAIQAGRFSGLLIVGNVAVADKTISRIFSKVKGRYAYINPSAGEFRKRTTPGLLNPVPWALVKSSLAAFAKGEATDKEKLRDCKAAMHEHLKSHKEVEKFMADMTKATGVKSPIVTRVMIGIFVAVFIAMVVRLFAITSPHRIITTFPVEFLKQWGATFGPAVADGQYWRIISSGFVHASFMHILFNAMGCWFFGAEVERYQGRARLVGCFLFAVITGNLAGLMVHPDSTAVGASGGLFGLIGMMAAMTIRYYRQFPPTIRQALKSWIMTILLYNVAFVFVPQVDISAHVGGFVGGLVMGLIVARPPLSKSRPSVFTVLMALILLVVTVNVGIRVIGNLREVYKQRASQPVQLQLNLTPEQVEELIRRSQQKPKRLIFRTPQR